MESTRQQKVSRMLQRELSEYFRQFTREFLPGKMVSVTVVRISPDLGVAKVYLSIFPYEKEDKPLDQIREHGSAIRKYIGQKIKNQVRAIPEFIYYLDDSLDYIDNIDNLLKED